MNRKAIADAFAVPVDELFGRCRTNRLVAIRAAIASVMYEQGADVYQIAHELGRDRTSILYLLGRTTSSNGIEYKAPDDWMHLLATARNVVSVTPEPRKRANTIYSQSVQTM